MTTTLTKTSAAKLPTPHGTFEITVFTDQRNGREHVALTLGALTAPVLTRVHSKCLTGDTLLSLRCDCREQLHQSMRRIGEAGSGIILYLDQEGRGIGLANKITAYALQDKGADTFEANETLGLPIDARDYGAAAEILRAFGVRDILLLTNSPDKEQQLVSLGIRVRTCILLEAEPNEYSRAELLAKKNKLGHHMTRL